MNPINQIGQFIRYFSNIPLTEREQLDGVGFTMNLTWNRDGSCGDTTDAFMNAPDPNNNYPVWNPSGGNFLVFYLRYINENTFQILLNGKALNAYGGNNNILITLNEDPTDLSNNFIFAKVVSPNQSWIASQMINKATNGILYVQDFGDFFPIRTDASPNSCYAASFRMVNNSPGIELYNSVVTNLKNCCNFTTQPTNFRNMCSRLGYDLNSQNCVSTMISHCGENKNIINDPSCKTFCQQRDSDCDGILYNYCNNLTPQEVAEDKNCGCFRDQKVYDNYFEDLGARVSGIDLTTRDPNCAFPRCSGSDYKRYNWKQNPFCPATQICINAVEIDNSGNIIGNIDISGSNECKNIVVNPPVEQSLVDYMNSPAYYKDYPNIDDVKLRSFVSDISNIVLGDENCNKSLAEAKVCADNFPAECNIRDVIDYKGFDCNNIRTIVDPGDELVRLLTEYVTSSEFIRDNIPGIDKQKLSLQSQNIVNAVLSTPGCNTNIDVAKACADDIVNQCSADPNLAVVNNFNCSSIRSGNQPPSNGGTNVGLIAGVGLGVILLGTLVGVSLGGKKRNK